MRWCLALLICCFLAAVNALSSSGSRLLAVLEDTEQKSLYSTLWADLEGILDGSTCNILLTFKSQLVATMFRLNPPKVNSFPCSSMAKELMTTSSSFLLSLEVGNTNLIGLNPCQLTQLYRPRPLFDPQAHPRLHEQGWEHPP